MPKCIECNKTIPNKSKFCNFCGVKQEHIGKKTKYYVRSDGLHECIKVVEMPDGTKKRKPFRGKTDAEVDRKILAFQGIQENGRTFSTLAYEWEEYFFSDDVIEYNSRRHYKKPLERAIKYFGSRAAKTITEEDVEDYLQELSSNNHFTKKTITAHKSVISMIYDYHKKELKRYNPSLGATLPNKCKPSKKRVLPTDEEIEKVKSSLDPKNPISLMNFLVLYSGVRRGEACALQIGDIERFDKATDDGIAGWLHIRRELFYRGAKPEIADHVKTEAGIRDVPLYKDLSDVLPSGNADQFIFPIEYKTTFERHLRQYRKKIEIGCTLHQLRHGFCTFLFEAGVPAKVAAYYMGHADTSVTEEIYTHLRERKLREDASKLGKYFSGSSINGEKQDAQELVKTV